MDQDRQLQCNFCLKIFPCGCSLDDHMRSHVLPPATAGYGLREHPKKKMSFDDVRENQCAENSENHMKSHSQRTQRANDEDEDDESPLSKKQKRIASEYPKERVDCAIALMKLSRDIRKWGDGAPAESSDKNLANHQELGFDDEDDDSLKKRKKKIEDDGAIHEGAGSGYQCSFCGRVFTSGQALGGHKKTHYA